MKKSFTTFMLACTALCAFCQITLTENNIPVPGTVPLQNVSSQVTTAPAIGNDLLWDYSTISGQANANPYLAVNNDPNFPSAQFMLDQYFKNLTPALGYYYNQYYQITSTGAYVVGIHVPAQSFGLGALTGNASDTLYILENVIYYPASQWVLLSFPASAGSSWQSNQRHVVNMELTVSAGGLNKASLQQAFYFNRKDTIAGWGTLTLPAQNGFNNNVPVLQNKMQQYFVDSFYLNGSPAPPQLTTAFGITQGQTTGLANRMVFYREGSFNYQMIINFTDETLTTPNLAYISTQLPVISGIEDNKNYTMPAVTFPNPVNGNHFTIQMPEETKAATVSIRDLTGRLVETVTPATNGNALSVALTNTLATGLYTYTVNDITGKLLAQGKLTAAQ